jgi:ADP-ribose pyrophosphatase YjhB (NUDIX family)
LIKQKVYAYITWSDRLLVFRHVDEPDAGIQVPGGTVEAGEKFEDAVRREVREEAGLENLELVGLVGMDVRDFTPFGLEEVQQRRFYHLRSLEEPPERWRHVEADASDGSGPLLFEFWWVRIPDGIPVIAGMQGEYLAQLKNEA